MDVLGIKYLGSLRKAEQLDYYVYEANGVENDIRKRIAHGENICVMKYSELKPILDTVFIIMAAKR